MANVDGAYCGVEDLRTGDIRLPAYLGSPEQRIKSAAEEIDAAIGHIYKTPIVIEESAANRPAILTLKKINWLITSGRIMLDINATGEQDNQHAFGMGMLKEGLAMLKQIAERELDLNGAEKIGTGLAEGSYTGPAIHNEDPESLVQSFYRGRSLIDPRLAPVASPYGFPPRIL